MEQNEALARIAERMSQQYGPRGSELNGPRIAAVIGQLASSGALEPGQRLPTVRALSAQLHVSPGTVADAWRVLRSHAVIATDRRRGTVVRSTSGNVDGRYWHVPVAPGTLDYDLSMGTPDPELLPPLGPALRKIQLEPHVTSYLDDPVLPELDALLRSQWPYEPERLTIVDGAQDGLDRVVNAIVHFGDAVIVEDPSFPPMIDMLELAGARLAVVRVDEDGPLPDDFSRALEEKPVAAFLQPRAHNPTGVSMSKERSRELAELIEGHPVTIVEDDHSGLISGATLESIGQHLPEQTVHIHSFSKSHGPDLRLAAIGGPAVVLDAVIKRRHLGPSWTSRLLQRILLELLTDDDAVEIVKTASTVYSERRAALLHALNSHNIEIGGRSGINLWIPTTDDQRTVVALSTQGIGVARGRPFMVENHQPDFVRVTIASLSNDAEMVAERIAAAR